MQVKYTLLFEGTIFPLINLILHVWNKGHIHKYFLPKKIILFISVEGFWFSVIFFLKNFHITCNKCPLYGYNVSRKWPGFFRSWSISHIIVQKTANPFVSVHSVTLRCIQELWNNLEQVLTRNIQIFVCFCL